jgi:hypothetical protein
LLLPLEREDAAFPALVEAVARRDGWFDPDDEQWPVTSVGDLAPVAGASVERDGDWLVLATDEEGDPKWSEQATAFYVELASWVTEGSVHLVGEDETEWSYSYADGVMTQSGVNGWDGSIEPFGDPVEDKPPAPARQRRGWFRRR